MTGRYLGVIDLKGRETLVPTLATDTNGKASGIVGGDGAVIPINQGKLNAITSLKPTVSFENSAGALGYTMGCTFISPVPFYAMRFRFFNVCTTATANVTAGVAASANMAGGTFVTTGAPSQIKVAGSATFSLPAASSGGGTDNAIWSETVSDIIYVSSIPRNDGGVGYLCSVRVFAPTAGNTETTRATGIGAGATSVNTLGFATSSALTDVTFSSWGSFAEAAAGGIGPAFAVDIFSTQGSINAACFGDSTFAGTDNNDGGGLNLAAVSLLSRKTPVVWWNQGESAMSSTAYYALALQALASSFRPNVAAMSGFSPNDSDAYTAAGTSRQIAQMAGFIDACKKYGVVPILVTPNPVSSLTSGQETFRRQVVTATKQLAAAFSTELIDRDAIFTNYSVATGGWLPGMNFNAVHASPSGFALESQLWAAVLSKYTGS